ncbi:MAG: beta-galactosidase [Clostridiales bacterium]|nr:beta-galactosidase [Clostridiales bacterium]
MKKLLFGAAYYDEYMPYDRLEKDVQMMKKAGINVVRIAESTWSTCEPQPGVFDFSHVERVMDAMEAADISVIIGTPTYAIPTWMVKRHPEVMAITEKGRNGYGFRQQMDITNLDYRFYAERVIRELMKVTAHRKCVIGYQIDNETKHYGTAGENVQQQFLAYLREKFHDDTDAMNREFGLDYWSNRLNSWDDYVDVRSACNQSLKAEFEKFQRSLVTEFLCWQADIVNEYRREDQFITHNFDGEWRDYSFGIQPDADHFQEARAVTMAGFDIYHPSQDLLTGKEIAFGGDIARSLKGGENYLILETQAQGYISWLPYQGQLRLQAYSHLSEGANSVMYWHWHSIHNSVETYWRGILSQDFEENATYREACRIGEEFAAKGDHLVNLKKKNEVAILVSNPSLTALKYFPIEFPVARPGIQYNDVFRWMFDTLYDMNVECDILWPESENLEDYRVIVAPALYAAEDELLHRLNRFVENGGHLIASFKSGYSNENNKVRCGVQPGILNESLGVIYHEYTLPRGLVGLSGAVVGAGEHKAEKFMELLIPHGAEVLASYDHYSWKEYAAITRNHYGRGTATYVGTMADEEVLANVCRIVLEEAGVDQSEEMAGVAVHKGVNDYGKMVRYYLNYSPEERSVSYRYGDAVDVLTGEAVAAGTEITVGAWDLRILEEQ